MRKTATTVVTTALGITMGLTLTACGGNDEKPDAGATSTSPTTASSTPAKTKAVKPGKKKPGAKPGKTSAPTGPRAVQGPGFAFQLPVGWKSTPATEPGLLAQGVPASNPGGQGLVLDYGDGRPPMMSLQSDGGQGVKPGKPVKIAGDNAQSATGRSKDGDLLTRYLWSSGSHRFELTFTLSSSMSDADRQALIDGVLKSWTSS